jgi:23S rRNA (adenine2503-C2)-methyltransferase
MRQRFPLLLFAVAFASSMMNGRAAAFTVRGTTETLTTSSSATIQRLSLSSTDEPIPTGPLSMSIDELAIHLGGRGRARIAWDCYLLGVDPIQYYAQNSTTNDNSIASLLPTGRRSATLGKDALQRLTNIGGQVDGGIATLSHISTSADRTTKLLLKLQDGLEVETVIIPWNEDRSTICISSQVGCRQACTFCATGKMGLLRNLSSDEILSQVFFALRITRQNYLPPITHVVFMGMGEPADNAEAVVKAVQQLTTRELFQWSRSKVTISTVAPSPDAFGQLAKANAMLAWSVHASNDILRKQLVPTTKYPMTALRQGLMATLQTRHPVGLRTIMMEVALMEGINDRLDDADHLADFLSPILNEVPSSKLAVNLIPFNDIGHPTYKTPSSAAVQAFQQRLWKHGIAAFVRTTRGDDESAACGQLATKSKMTIRERNRVTSVVAQ